MSENQRVDAKRIRRTFEPETKTWNDDLLEVPWDAVSPPLSKPAIFALKNVFFFPHATSVQAATVPLFSQDRQSVIVEAPTGCGKTLSFVVPLLERLVQQNDDEVLLRGRPFLHRNIVAIILSPSRVLAEQTFVVTRNYSSRFPHNFHVALCDGVVETPVAVAEHLCRASRGGGTILVTTPHDALDFFAALDASLDSRQKRGGPGGTDDGKHRGAAASSRSVLVDEELLQGQDEQTRERYLRKLEAKRKAAAASDGGSGALAARSATDNDDGGRDAAAAAPHLTNSMDVSLCANPGHSFVVIVDEADIVLSAEQMRLALTTIVRRCAAANTPPAPPQIASLAPAQTHQQLPQSASEGPAGGEPTDSKSKKKQKKSAPRSAKRAREGEPDTHIPDATAAGAVDATCDSRTNVPSPSKALVDVGLFGATVGLTASVAQFAESLSKECDTEFRNVSVARTVDFSSDLTNRFVLCSAEDMLPCLIHCLNQHPTKKHFVFFNHSAVLLFVKAVLQRLSQGSRPLLYVHHIYAMYESMTESAKFAEYNGFLQHQPTAMKATPKHRTEGAAAEKNPHFQSGWTRDGRPALGTGAVLLCTNLAAFGLDVRDVDYLYHFEPPTSVASYIHRIGRVGRMGMRGLSVLLLPCGSTDARRDAERAGQRARERKQETNRYHTLTNTKQATFDVQSAVVTEDDLSDEKRAYLVALQEGHQMARHQVLPPPITSSVRAVIQTDERLVKLGRQAAIALCRGTSAAPPAQGDVVVPVPIAESAVDESVTSMSGGELLADGSWFDPTLAIATLLLA